ncbi:hypothetical protein [Aliiroseovarius subalbicans]|uniref:hypothetical protein n=1 Tax=Aliiroseovarius subalbicans TaxID=2925840 RepID=UPI001F56B085|nr:hypothetical protein [Aliiroseovarius subalbicans]MCI2401186.1 hypothetical protein [Aliiroseovarius subalbicans]
MNKFLPGWAGKVLQDRQARAEDPEGFAVRAVVAPHFDRDFYLRANPDVAKAAADPVAHYLDFGWSEGRDPHPDFSTREYLWNNPDVDAAGINPYWHHLVFGRDEGRTVFEPPEPDPIQLLFELPDLEEEVALWTEDRTPPNLVTPDVFGTKLRESLEAGAQDLVISFGQDHYRENTGGVQVCLQREERAARRQGMSYLNLSPHQPLPRCAHDSDEDACALRVVLDGETLGVLGFDAVRDLLGAITPGLSRASIVIHHLLGHMPEHVLEIAQIVGVSEAWFWLHDYFSICPGYTLMRNKRVFCAAPPPASLACKTCCFGAERLPHIDRMTHLFTQLDMHVIAPSKVARDIWVDTAALPHKSLTVQPHAALDWDPAQGGDDESAPEQDGLRVAYVGSPMPHKGWKDFKNLHKAMWDDKEITFHYFGTAEVPARLAKTPVRVTEKDEHAMMHAIRDAGIDIMVMWAHWPETYSFATLEAICGGAFVVTNPNSGNVAALVKALGRGLVFEDVDELLAFFQGPDLRRALEKHRAQRRRQVPRLHYSDMTIPLLEREGQ